MSVRDRATMSGEFPKNPPGQALRDRLEAGRRIAQSCVTNVFGDSANNAAMATSLGTVLAIGVYEGAISLILTTTLRAFFPIILIYSLLISGKNFLSKKPKINENK